MLEGIVCIKAAVRVKLNLRSVLFDVFYLILLSNRFLIRHFNRQETFLNQANL